MRSFQTINLAWNKSINGSKEPGVSRKRGCRRKRKKLILTWRNKFNKTLKKVTKEIGIPYLSSHKIRFWSVTALARATGGDIQTVMYAAGHVDKNTTLHYIRAVKSDVQTDKIKQCFG